MESIKKILALQLTERELILFMLYNTGKYSYRDLGDPLGLTPEGVSFVIRTAKEKIKTQGLAIPIKEQL